MRKYKIKSAKTDFTQQQLPGNRRALFWDCMSVQFSVVVRLCLLCAVFMTPYLAAVMVGDAIAFNAHYAETEELLHSLQLISGGLKLAAMTVFFLLFSGIVQIIRQLLWEEQLFLWDDFKNGIKNNALTFMLTAFLMMLPEFVLSWNPASDIANIFKGICAVTIIPVGGWVMVQAVYYRLGISDSLRNSLIFYIKAFPVTILLEIAFLLPFYLVEAFILHLMARYILILLVAAVLIVPLTMISLLYAGGLFDRYINQENYPQLYRKGLRPEGAGERHEENL